MYVETAEMTTMTPRLRGARGEKIRDRSLDSGVARTRLICYRGKDCQPAESSGDIYENEGWGC